MVLICMEVDVRAVFDLPAEPLDERLEIPGEAVVEDVATGDLARASWTGTRAAQVAAPG